MLQPQDLELQPGNSIELSASGSCERLISFQKKTVQGLQAKPGFLLNAHINIKFVSYLQGAM